MNLAKNQVIEYPIAVVPGEVITVQFKTVGTKVNSKINVDIHVHFKVDSLGRGKSTNVANSGPISVFTNIGDNMHSVTLLTPQFKITNAVKSVVYITTDSYAIINISEMTVMKGCGTFVGGKGGGFTGVEPLVPGLDGIDSGVDNGIVRNGIYIVCEGLMLGHSGFAKATRNFTYGLDRLGCNVKAVILDADSIKSSNTSIGRRILQLSNNQLNIGSGSVGRNVGFRIMMNFPLGVKKYPGFYCIAYIMFETVDFPTAFVQHILKSGIDEIWTPSTFCKESMIRAGLGGVRGGIRVMPLGVDTEIFNREIADEPRYIPGNLIDMKDKYKFLSVMGYSERKGVNILVRAFAEEFGLGNGGQDRDKVALYLKGGWYDIRKARSEIAGMIKDISNPPHIHVDFNIYPDDVLISLYKACDCFVLPSRGEGWSLPCCEAMSMGLPTIATRWSGNLAFMDINNSYLIDIEGFGLEPRCNWVTGYYVGQKFAIPSIRHLRQLFRHVYEHQEEAREKGRLAREWMVKNFDWKVSCKRMKDRLQEILG